MLEEARLPLVNPLYYEMDEEDKDKDSKKINKVIVLDISPKNDNEIEL
jgi:hypothetical protein